MLERGLQWVNMLGYASAQAVEQVLRQLPSPASLRAARDAAIDWLCLHLPEEHLPLAFQVHARVQIVPNKPRQPTSLSDLAPLQAGCSACDGSVACLASQEIEGRGEHAFAAGAAVDGSAREVQSDVSELVSLGFFEGEVVAALSASGGCRLSALLMLLEVRRLNALVRWTGSAIMQSCLQSCNHDEIMSS